MSKNGVVQANRTAQALTSVHMSGLARIQLIKQRLQRNITRREVKLRNGRVAKLLVKTENGVGLLKTPWIDASKGTTEAVLNASVSNDSTAEGVRAEATAASKKGKRSVTGGKSMVGKRTNVEIGKSVMKALRLLKK